MAEFEVQISNSRGTAITHEPKMLRGGRNRIPVGKHAINIGILSKTGAIVLNQDDRLSMRLLTSERGPVFLSDDRCPIMDVMPGEVVEITFQPTTYRGIPRHVFVERRS